MSGAVAGTPHRPSVELYADCPSCLTEAAVVERYDQDQPACCFGLPAEARCRLCGERREGRVTHHGLPVRGDGAPTGLCPACRAPLSPAALNTDCCPCGATAELVTVEAGTVPVDEAALADRIERWGKAEGYADLRAFMTATFLEPDLATILANLRAGTPVATLADPFALRGAQAAAAPTSPTEGPAPSTLHRAPAVPTAAPSEPCEVDGRALLYPLLAVLAADGEIHPAERALVNAFLASEGLAPLADTECRVHRPADVAPRVPLERRRALLRLMCETALVDGLPDGNELRVIHAYAAAWNVPRAVVEEWLWASERTHLPRGKALWLKLRRFVLVSLWGVPAGEVEEHERAAALSRSP